MAVILVVEDNVFIREIAEMLFHDWGHQTLSATDVSEAIVHLQSPQHIDALFTDIYLKKEVIGGCDFAAQAIDIHSKLRVLYTSGNFITEQMKSMFVKGSQFLCKPYTPDQLHGALDQLLLA